MSRSSKFRQEQLAVHAREMRLCPTLSEKLGNDHRKRVTEQSVESLAVRSASEVTAFTEGEFSPCAIVRDAGLAKLRRLRKLGDAADDMLGMPPLAPAAGAVSP